MDAAVYEPKARGVSRWWRAVAIGLAVGIAIDVIEKRRIVIPAVPEGSVRVSPAVHDARFFKPLPAVIFADAPFDRIARWIAANSGVRINFSDVAGGGRKFDLILEPATCRHDLDRLIDAVNKPGGTNGEPLAILDDGNAMSVVPVAQAAEVRVYDIRSLLDEMREEADRRGNPTPRLVLGQQNGPQGSLFAAATSQAATQPDPPYLPEADLQQLLAETIDPTSWKQNGGTMGSSTFVAASTVVTQTEENHRQIEALLMGLRRR